MVSNLWSNAGIALGGDHTTTFYVVYRGRDGSLKVVAPDYRDVHVFESIISSVVAERDLEPGDLYDLISFFELDVIRRMCMYGVVDLPDNVCDDPSLRARYGVAAAFAALVALDHIARMPECPNALVEIVREDGRVVARVTSCNGLTSVLDLTDVVESTYDEAPMSVYEIYERYLIRNSKTNLATAGASVLLKTMHDFKCGDAPACVELPVVYESNRAAFHTTVLNGDRVLGREAAVIVGLAENIFDTYILGEYDIKAAQVGGLPLVTSYEPSKAVYMRMADVAAETVDSMCGNDRICKYAALAAAVRKICVIDKDKTRCVDVRTLGVPRGSEVAEVMESIGDDMTSMWLNYGLLRPGYPPIVCRKGRSAWECAWAEVEKEGVRGARPVVLFTAYNIDDVINALVAASRDVVRIGDVLVLFPRAPPDELMRTVTSSAVVAVH